jgi:hypothetical protein
MEMKNWIKRITGIADLEAAAEAATAKRIEEEMRLIELAKLKHVAEQETEEAIEKEISAKLSPKERATANEEPWINVLDIQYNQDDIRNGFFELDWNHLFIIELRQNGYGADGDAEEEIVDRWFKDIVFQMLNDEGLDTRRGSGYINVVPLDKGKSEVS